MAFPQELEAARELVEEHTREIPDEKVVFAAYYSPDGNEPYVIEVVENFGFGIVGYEGDLMDTEYKPFGKFARTSDKPVHLVLSNPTELKHAWINGWHGANLLREAMRQHRYKVLVSNPEVESTIGDSKIMA